MSKVTKFKENLTQQTLLHSADVMITELEACRIWCEDNEPNINILNRMYHMTCVLENIQGLLWNDFKYSQELKEFQAFIDVEGDKVLEQLPNVH